MYRGKVTAVDAKGVYVQTADYGTIGPCQVVGATPDVDDMVLAANVGTDVAPDLVVLSGGTPATSTDNTVPRFDGTGGALQGSGVTIDDGGYVTVPGTNAGIDVNGSATSSVRFAGAYSQVQFRNQTGDARWAIAKNGSESGDIGSDLEIDRFDSGGGHVNVVVYRSTGRWSFRDVGPTAGLEFGASGPTITTGTGAPSHSAPDGSTYHRTDGTASTTLYVRAAGAWSALS